jgi:hypothetical protein
MSATWYQAYEGDRGESSHKKNACTGDLIHGFPPVPATLLVIFPSLGCNLQPGNEGNPKFQGAGG